MPYLDDNTMDAIEADLAAAHQSYAHGDLDMKTATKTGIKILETVVPAAAFSYMNARSAGGEMKVGPVPVDLAVGLGLSLLAMFDVAGGYEDDLLNIGIGALASYGARTGAAFGAAAAAAPQTASGLEISGSGATSIAERVRRRMTHHVSGEEQLEGVSGAVPKGTQRFVVRQVA